MSEQRERIRQTVLSAAERLTAVAAEVRRLNRRDDFLRELRERGNWLANGPAEPPPWVERWNKYWNDLAKDPPYGALLAEERDAHAALHSAEFESAIELLRLRLAGEPADWAIAYLEADPWYFRSGYLKTSLSRWLRQVELTDAQRDWLRDTILRNLPKGSRLDFTETRKLVRRLDTPQFRAKLDRLTHHRDLSTVDRARRLLTSCVLNDTSGRDLRQGSVPHIGSPAPATEESGERVGGEGWGAR
ncbi:MAG: hypothetical protein ABI577_09425 [bacterium]